MSTGNSLLEGSGPCRDRTCDPAVACLAPRVQTRFVVLCPACAKENPDGFEFCGFCRSPLASATLPPTREERKVVTVLFCDLVGFTTAAEQLDPEDVRAVLGPYHSRLRVELERHGGTVEKFIGDAVMALFGAPAAHEDDPERAIRPRSQSASSQWRRGSSFESGSRPVRRSSHSTRSPPRAKGWRRAMSSTRPRACRARP